MKMSWGTGIATGIIVFVFISLSMTLFFMTQDVHLVTDDYYEKTLSYQNEINKQSRTNALDEDVKMKFDGEMVNIVFPSGYPNKDITGEIFFYRPSDPYLDFKLPLRLSENGIQIVPAQRIEKGFWRIKLSWTMDGIDYYNENTITIE